jgi:O-antigen/teichoic acid export membrane protein
VANLLNWAIESVDRAFVSRWWGSERLGEYALAANLARAPVMLLVGAAQSVAFASAARLQDEHARIARGYVAVVALALALATPIFVFLAWHARFVIELLYGLAWSGAGPAFAWLALGVPPFVMLALTGPMLRGLGAVTAEMQAQIAVLLLLVLALAWLAERGDTPLAAVAAVVALTSLVRAVALYRALARRIGLARWAWLRIVRGGGLLALVAAASCGVWVAASPAWAFVGSLLTAMAGCALVLRATRGSVLAVELLQALDNRRGDSRMVRGTCALLGRPA